MLGGIHILEEGIGKFADRGVVHLVIFISEMLLHDPLVARHEAAIGFECCNNVPRHERSLYGPSTDGNTNAISKRDFHSSGT